MPLAYAELHVRSAFSFLRGSASPEQLAEAAAACGIAAVALCDRNGLYGAPRFYSAATRCGIRAIVGVELTMEDGTVLPVLVENRTGYCNLCRLITTARLRGTKTDAPVQWAELGAFSEGLVALTGDEEGPLMRLVETDDLPAAEEVLQRLIGIFGPKSVFVEMQHHQLRGREATLNVLYQLARSQGLLPIASNGVRYALDTQRSALDVFTCVRQHTTLDAAGDLLSANAQAHMKTPEQMQHLFSAWPGAVENTAILAERLTFGLRDLGYEFPRYPVPDGETMDSVLWKVTMQGARKRYQDLRPAVHAQLERELTLIRKLGFSGYFLIVWDIVNFCVDNNILVQGRGSAANSAVCYSLGITACDPIAYELLFERFLSEGRTSWPDIDLDLPSGERRERVIQEVYRRYGRHGSAMTANVITYRGRSAMREIGKALGFSPDILQRFSSLFASGDFPHTLELKEQIRKAGVPDSHPRAAAALSLYQQIHGLPRHLGQHSGGMIICQGQLDSIVPLEPASMPGRTVAQWDKDDCEDLGIIKVDLLGLGMMATLQDTLELCKRRGRPIDLAALPQDDPTTYAMMRKADTVGVFQIESRAQMATLPRMKPTRFYDVVVEVAIIRPGPIQGDMLHPYLARRSGREPVHYIHPDLEPVLRRTLGVPLFQEQLLRIAMVMADFTGSEAEELRRALSFHRSHERMDKVCVKLRAAMQRKPVQPEVIEQIVKAVQSFAVYGFPESHAISFAMIAYASAWLKAHRGVEFLAGLLNNQPMGFYSPATLLKDGLRHGIRAKPVSVIHSFRECTVIDDETLRLGLCMVRGLSESNAVRIVAERGKRAFDSLADFQLRVPLSKAEARTLAKIGAFNGLADHRRDALWKVERVREQGDLFAPIMETDPAPLSMMKPMERTFADYEGMAATTGPHPMALIRGQLSGLRTASELAALRGGERVRVAGAVICRQRPGTAKGFVFLSLEDETGISNIILEPKFFEMHRLVVTQEPFLCVEGVLQNTENVVHVKALQIGRLEIAALPAGASHDFH